MGSVMGKGGANTPKIANGLKPQTSAYGGVVNIPYGVSRIPGNLIWYGDFEPHVPTSSGNKGGSSTKGKGNSQTTYSASFMLALGEGPAYGFGAVWGSQVETTFPQTGFSDSLGAIAQSPWPFLTTHHPRNAETYSGIITVQKPNAPLGTSPTLSNYNFELFGLLSRITATKTLSVPASTPFTIQPPRTVVAGTFTNAQGNTVGHSFNYFYADVGVKYHGGASLTKVGSSPTVGQYTVSATGLYGFNSGDASASLDITYQYYGDVNPADIIQDVFTNQRYGIDFPANRLGTVRQANEAHTIPGSPFQITVTQGATFLANLCVVDGSGNIFTCVPLAQTPLTRQYHFDITTGQYTFATADAGTAITIRYAWRDVLVSYKAFCWASSLMMSPSFDTQVRASQIFDDFAKHTYSEWVLQAYGVLGIFPRGESPLSDWNYSYTPNLTPLFNLTDDDFLPNTNPTGAQVGGTSDDPVIVSRPRPVDQVNNIKGEFLDRQNQYAPSIAEITDQANLDLFRRRSSASRTMHWFCDITAANISVQLQLQKEQARNMYNFALDPRYCMLECMDPVTVQDPKATNGLQQLVRIAEITENDDGTLSIVAEEYPNGTGSAAIYSYQNPQGAIPNFSDSPSDVNAPIFLDMPVGAALAAGGSRLEIWAPISGQDMTIWGGATPHLSTDGGSTYFDLPKQFGASRMGVTTAPYPVGSDPDTTDTLSVNLTESQGALANGTTSDADNALTLCAVMTRAAPLPPTLSQVSSGSLPATAYSVRISYVFSGTEGPSSLAASFITTANFVLHVASPAASTGATGWNVYVGATPGAETLQNSSPIAIGTPWQEPTTGLYIGTPVPNSCLFELISYSDAALTSTYNYNLDTYVRRGQYGTAIIDHPTGEPFARLDGQLVKEAYNPSQYEAQIDTKFTSFNVFTGGEEDISVATDYPHIIQGPPPLPAPTNVTVSVSAGIYAIKWDDLRSNPQLAPAVSGYDVLYGATNLMGPVFPVVLGYQGNSLTTADIPAGTWAIYVRGVT